MSEPTPGTLVPANNPQGTGAAPEQPQQTPPNQAAPQQPIQAAPTQTPASDAALQQRLEQAEKMARHYQSQFSQARQQLQAVTGATPQADPVETKAAAYAKQFNINIEDARVFVAMMQAENAPLVQHNQQLQAQLQGSSLAQQVFQSAADANPELFADQNIAREVWDSMQQTAQQGNLRALTPEYAKFLGAQAWALKHEPWKTNPAPPQPMNGYTPRPMAPLGFNGPGSQYSPMPPQQQPEDPSVNQLAERMAAKWTGDYAATKGKTLSQLQQKQS